MVYSVGGFYQSQYAQSVKEPPSGNWQSRLHDLAKDLEGLKNNRNATIQDFFKVEDKIFELGKNVVDQDPNIDGKTKEMFWQTYDSCIRPLEYSWEMPSSEWAQFKEHMLSASKDFFHVIADGTKPQSEGIDQKAAQLLALFKDGKSPSRQEFADVETLLKNSNNNALKDLGNGLAQIWELEEPPTASYTKEKLLNFLDFLKENQ